MTKSALKRVPRHWTLEQRLAHWTAPPNENGCHLWRGSLIGHGYGHLKWNDRLERAHRLVWQLTHGPIPDGMHVCHRCDVRSCVNPDHLFLGTDADNIADMDAKGRRGTTPGTTHGKAKLTEADVLAIRVDPRTHEAIADAYGVQKAAIGKIKRGVNWKHIAS